MLLLLVSSARQASAWIPSKTASNGRLLSCRAASGLILPDSQDEIHTVMAPMVAASDYAFRRLVQQHGTDLVFTQMLHARNLVRDAKFRQNHFDFPFNSKDYTVSQKNCIAGMEIPTIQHPAKDGPLIVQLAGHEPELMVQAAHLLLDEGCEFQGICVNLGCPQAIARKGNYGAFLCEHDLDLTCTILQKLRESVPPSKTVSAKIRLPTSLLKEDIENRVLRLMDTGISFLTIHGRTLVENKTKTGGVHVPHIKWAVDAIDGRIPVIANGGIESLSDVSTLREQTGAAAIMSSEALLEHPNLFETNSILLSPQELFQQQVKMARSYINLAAQYPPVPGVLGHADGSYSIVKGHLFKMLHRYLQRHVHVRDQLTQSTNLVQALEVIQSLERVYGQYTDGEWASCSSSQKSASWYRRHWEANRRVHQRNRPVQQQEEISIEDKKERIKQRIAKLRQSRRLREDIAA